MKNPVRDPVYNHVWIDRINKGGDKDSYTEELPLTPEDDPDGMVMASTADKPTTKDDGIGFRVTRTKRK